MGSGEEAAFQEESSQSRVVVAHVGGKERVRELERWVPGPDSESLNDHTGFASPVGSGEILKRIPF